MDITFIHEKDKFVSGVLMALSAIIMLGIFYYFYKKGLPHLTVLRKCDLINDKKLIKRFLKD